MTPEQQARGSIDALLIAAGWHICNVSDANIHAATGVAIREFPLDSGFGFADYLLYVNGKACGVIEAKKQGATLTGVELQSGRYAQGLPANLPAWTRPLPFVWESTGVETHFTNGLDPEPRARAVFAFFRPELLVQWLTYLPVQGSLPQAASNSAQEAAGTFLARMRQMPQLVTEWGSGGAHYALWPAQISAITNLEKSLAANKPKSLIQMATGSGKTFTSIGFIYRLIKFGGARRVLFLVDRGNLARQTKKEFDGYESPYNNYKFGQEYIVQHLQGSQIDTSARVVICTIQRMFSLLKGRELAEEADEESTEKIETLFKDPEPIGYNPAIPIEMFDIVVTDEAHRSIYNLWRQVLEYFDAYLIGLTATPNKQTFGFFNQNLVMEYGHAQAVADGVNVNYDVYRIKTEVSEQGARVDKGFWLETQDKATRRKTAWQLDDDFEYQPEELDRAVQTPDQIRTVVRTLRDRWQPDMFPSRTELPKTLVFAKDDNHAEKIVEVLREEFGRGNEFAQKIYVPGLAGVSQFEQHHSESVVRRGVASGDANLYLRNVLWLIKEKGKIPELALRMKNLFPKFEIWISFDSVNDIYIDVDVSTTGPTGRRCPLELAGTGVQQALQIFSYVTLFEPRLLLLDEPDSHLHPDNQGLLAAALQETVNATATQVIVSTHSRYLVDSLHQDANFIWLKEGKVHEQGVGLSKLPVLLELGALDSFDKLMGGAYDWVFLTEDRDRRMLETLLAANGFPLAKCLFYSYKTSTNIEAAKLLTDFIRESAPLTRVVIHRDRDFMMPAEVIRVSEGIESCGAIPFITSGCDIESYFLAPGHVGSRVGAAVPAVIDWLDEIATAEHTELQHSFTRKRDEIKSAMYRGNPKDCPDTLALLGKAIPLPPELRHGKKMIKRVRAGLKAKFGVDSEIIAATPALICPRLNEIAALKAIVPVK